MPNDGVNDKDTTQQVLELLQRKGKLGVDKKELLEEFNYSQYVYKVILNLVKVDKACKISDRWYYGVPADWFQEDYLLNVKNDLIQLFLCTDFHLGQETLAKIDFNNFETKASEGLLHYLLYCRVNNLPLPLKNTTEMFFKTQNLNDIKGRVIYITNQLK